MERINNFKILFFCLCIVISQTSRAQESSLIFSRGGNMYYNGSESIPYEGSPYYSEDWHLGKVVFENGEVSDKMNLMIDLFKSRVIRQTENNSGEYLDVKNISGILLEDGGKEVELRKIQSNKFKEGSDRTYNFYEILKPVNAQFVKGFNVKFINGEDVNKGRALVNPDYTNRFEMSQTYYVLMKDGFYNRIKPTKKGVFNCFEDNKKQIEEYVSKNKLNYKSIDDLSEIIAFYYSLED